MFSLWKTSFKLDARVLRGRPNLNVDVEILIFVDFIFPFFILCTDYDRYHLCLEV